MNGGIMEYGRLSRENTPHAHKPNGWLWKRVSGQVAAKSLEWIHWAGFLNMAESNHKKATGGQKYKTLIIDKGSSFKTANEYGLIPPDQNSPKLGHLPYFLKISEIRKIIYVFEGVCTLKTYKVWHNHLYKAGYTETMLSTANRLLAIELGTYDQYYLDTVFETSSQKEISARNAMGTCFFEPRLTVGLLPEPVLFGHPWPPGGRTGQ